MQLLHKSRSCNQYSGMLKKVLRHCVISALNSYETDTTMHWIAPFPLQWHIVTQADFRWNCLKGKGALLSSYNELCNEIARFEWSAAVTEHAATLAISLMCLTCMFWWWEEIHAGMGRKCKLHAERPHPSQGKPGTFLLWGNSAKLCCPVQLASKNHSSMILIAYCLSLLWTTYCTVVGTTLQSYLLRLSWLYWRP